MAIDTTPSTVATNALQAIPFSSLIGGPLDACIKAQAIAAQTSWEFIQNVGLSVDPATGEKKAVNVSFQYQKDGQMVNLVVPLLAIVPIPYIAIDTITIDFMAKIDASSSSVSEQTSEKEAHGEMSGKGRVGWGPFSVSVEFKGGMSSKSSSKATQESKYSVEYTMNVHVEAGQDSMPAGLATVLGILNSAITEGSVKGTYEVSPMTARLEYAKGATAQIGVKSRNSQDLGINDPIEVTFDYGTNTGVIETNVTVTAIAGTYDGSATPKTLTPDGKGVAALALTLKDDTTALAASESVRVTLKQGSNTATPVIDVVKAG